MVSGSNLGLGSQLVAHPGVPPPARSGRRIIGTWGNLWKVNCANPDVILVLCTGMKFRADERERSTSTVQSYSIQLYPCISPSPKVSVVFAIVEYSFAWMSWPKLFSSWKSLWSEFPYLWTWNTPVYYRLPITRQEGTGEDDDTKHHNFSKIIW